MAARIGLALMLAIILSAPASAQTSLVNDNFDGYADQAAFEVVWAPIGGGTPAGSLGVIGGTLSTEQAVSPTFSIKNVSPPAPVPPEPTTSAYSQRNQLLFAESGTITPTLGIRWSFDLYDLAPTVSPYRQHANLQNGTAPGVTNELISMGMNNNQSAVQSGGQYYMARILGYSNPLVDPDGGPAESLAATNFFKLNDFTAPHRTEGWHNLKVELTTDDGLSTDYNFYVDNILAETVSNVGTAAQFRSYDVLRMGAGVSSTQDAYYDNFIVETFIPTVTPTGDADFDGDDDVDGDDFLTWQENLGLDPADQPEGNANSPTDTAVNGPDLAIWQTEFGTPQALAAVASIPEPASAALAAVALLASFAAARRR